MNNIDCSLTKRNLGQFYTTNYKYILQNLEIPDDVKNIIEPFVGNGDLLNFINFEKKYKIECYDIDPKVICLSLLDKKNKNKSSNNIEVIKRDTLKNPPKYKNKFVLTNPPYLARNKSKEKSVFDKYNTNDLYKCFLLELIKNKPLGGIIIIPLNFFSSIRKSDIKLRHNFLKTFNIIKLNIFEEKVFDDTSYTICSFQFSLNKINQTTKNKVKLRNITIYPSKKNINVSLRKKYNYMIGGRLYHLPQNKNVKIDRLTSKNIKIKEKYITNIVVKCIDNNLENKIGMSFVKDNERYVDTTKKLSARSFATLVIEYDNRSLNRDEQQLLVKKFNKYLEKYRKKYHSLFLTNYRESKDMARKRISFKLIYEITNYLLNFS